MNLEDHGKDNVVIGSGTAMNALEASNAIVKFYGSANRVEIGDSCIIQNLVLVFYGSGHKLVLGDGVKLYQGGIVFQGDRNLFSIGADTEVREWFNFNALEYDHKLTIGERCLFSNTVHLRNYDSHPIFDVETGARINEGRDLVIEDRVWICENVHILKGAHIGHDSVVGTGAVVTGKTFPPDSIIAGNPAKVVRSGIRWEV